MSKLGVAIVANILEQMQTARIELLPRDNQDKKLAQLLERAKDEIKDDFARIAAESPPTVRTARG